jgi:hypothetical protein
VKICSLYGVGFYYIPGTDMCLKVGGWARAEYTWGANGNIGLGGMDANVNNRTTNNSVWRARGYITADARNQTEYGTVRAYLAVGLSTNNVGADSASNTFSANRAFIQWAGFTFGLAQSFYDFYSVPATSYWGTFPASDTGDPGWMVVGYTAQFGNGFSASLAGEMRRDTVIGNANTAVALSNIFSGNIASSYGGFQAPDVVGNLRVDQAWGSAQIMAAGHQVNATYYSTPEASGHPDDKWGFAVGAGLKLNAPMIGHGDYLQTQVNYTEGASRYAFFATNFSYGFREGADAGFGILSDAIYGGALGTTATSLELTTAWNVNAAYEHFWNPRWRTSLYGGYSEVSYNDRANAMICSATGQGNGLLGSAALASAGCDNDWQFWWLGSRTQWNVTKDFYMGLDVLYQRLQTANVVGNTVATGPSGTVVGPLNIKDQDNWQFRFRVHRDFYP